MKNEIPNQDGFYWFFESKKGEFRPVEVNQEKYGAAFKSFNGAQQAWINDGDYFIELSKPKKDSNINSELEKLSGFKSALENATLNTEVVIDEK